MEIKEDVAAQRKEVQIHFHPAGSHPVQLAHSSVFLKIRTWQWAKIPIKVSSPLTYVIASPVSG